MILSLLLLQAAAAPPPDIELGFTARARSVTIERKGEAKLEVRGEGPGNRVDVKVEPKAAGRRQLRDVSVDVRARAFVQDGVKLESERETGTPR